MAGRRPLRARHRAPREPPHRQPAARPLRPPGRPGRARSFFLSLEDDLMRIFGSDRLDAMLQQLGLKEGEAIVHPWVNKALEKAQKKVEARNFDIRKNLLKYDDVMNDQRKAVFAQRREFMEATDVSETVADMRREIDRATWSTRRSRRRPMPSSGTSRASHERGAASSRPRAAGRRLGRRGGHRRDAIRERIERRGRRSMMAAQGRQYRPRAHAHRREEAAAADPRPAGTSICCTSTTCARASACAPTASATR